MIRQNKINRTRRLVSLRLAHFQLPHPLAAESTPSITAATTVLLPSPACEPAADPDGAMAPYPDLAAKGWCDSGRAGTFLVMPDANDFCSCNDIGGCHSGVDNRLFSELLATVVQTLKERVPAVPVLNQIGVTLVPVSKQFEQTFAPLLKTPPILP